VKYKPGLDDEQLREIIMTKRQLTMMLAAVLTLSAAPAIDRESFDTSGMPKRPTTFLEQQIAEMIASHQEGDLADAVHIQRKLGRYYSEKGDEARAKKALQRAEAAEEAAISARPPAPETSNPVAEPAPKPQPSPVHSKFSGNYYQLDRGTMETWDFHPDGTFLHTWIAGGSGTSSRTSERGRFRLDGEYLVLETTSSATAFATQGVGGRSTQLGGGSDTAQSTKRVKITFLGDSIALDGVKLKKKSW
jgi:hypothetical protein